MFLKLFGKKKSKTKVHEEGGQLVNGIDPEMNYCPQCEVEFRGDISSCFSCDVALISGKEKIELQAAADSSYNSRNMEISPDDELAPIRKGPLKDIKVLQKLLEKERIPAILAGDEGGCGKG